MFLESNKNRYMLNEMVQRIETKRKALGLTQNELAERAGLSTDAIRNIQRAAKGEESKVKRKGVSTHTVIQLASALEAPPEWVMFGVGEEQQSKQYSGEIDEITKFAIEQAGDIIWKIASRDSRINIDPDKFREVVVSTVEAAVLEKVESGHLAPDFTDNIVKFQIRKI